MDSSLISVILPVYNGADYLSEAIESILNQSYHNFELLIMNDGSTDHSKDIVNLFSDNRIKYFENDGNKGLIYTLNRGIDESNGKYIARMDADDIALPNRFKIQYEYMEQHPEIGTSGTYAEYFGDKSGEWKYPVSNMEIRCRLMWGSAIIHPASIIRKSTLTQNNIKFKDQYPAAEDYKLWVDISHVSELHNIPEVLLKYRTHSQQVTSVKTNTMDQTKTRIVLEQLSLVGVKLFETDFEIVFKFISYKYFYSGSELERLIKIYVDFISLNQKSQKFDTEIINWQIEERIFEACYFSTQKCGLNAIIIFKNNFNIKHISLSKKIKFFIKALKK